MKKYLPRFKKTSGFTLVELLVVVAIIAILTVIAISIYSGVQARSRDARRQTEIDSLAKSIAVRKDATAGTYTYVTANYDADYPNTKPQDPLGTSTRNYCIDTDNTAMPANPAAWTTSTCPAGYAAIPTTSVDVIATGVTYWKICASLEGSSAVFCKGSF